MSTFINTSKNSATASDVSKNASTASDLAKNSASTTDLSKNSASASNLTTGGGIITYLLLETGDKLLQENDSFIVLTGDVWVNSNKNG